MKVLIRPPVPEDEAAYVAASRRSRSLHRPWTRMADTPAQFAAHVERLAQPQNCGMLVCRRDTGALVGAVNITNIVLGPLRSGYVGYCAFAGHERQGLMREGLQLVVRHAFKTLKLNRLEANIQPGNLPSRALAAACGFQLEGYSPRYLKVGGRWCDHERWAIVA